MSGIRSKDTAPEKLIRTALHRRGFRFRLHVRDLPGKPDIVFPRYRAVIFVHGCFWHGHDCPFFRLPKTRPEFWRTKIQTNQTNDDRAIVALQHLGWRVAVVWECATRAAKNDPDQIVSLLAQWLPGGEPYLEVR
jgi:DNA mismatch endonuclease, patch repair protein